jgi:hypothetical protein
MTSRAALLGLGLLVATTGCAGTETEPSAGPAAGSAGGSVESGASGSGGSVTGGSTGGNAGPSCFGPCCQPPQQGAMCSTSNEGQSCPSSTLCEGGLVLSQELVCRSGTWQLEGETCPGLDGGVSTEGCPAAQPRNGDPCSKGDGSGSCMYRLVCPSKPCDAGSPPTDGSSESGASGTACASLSGKVAFATCSGGSWSTTPLGTCP